MDIPNSEPKSFRAGDTVKWVKSFDDYPSDQWTLVYRIINKDDSISVLTTPNANKGFNAVISSTESTNFTAGIHTIIGQVTKDDEAYTIINSLVEILPNLISSASIDLRTTAQKLLVILDESLLKHGVSAYTHTYNIEGRSLQFRTHEEFMKFRNQIKAEANQDTRKQQGKKRQTRILTVL